MPTSGVACAMCMSMGFLRRRRPSLSPRAMIGQPKRNPMAEKPPLDTTRLQNISQAYWLRAPTENPLGAYERFPVDDARRYHAATYSLGMGAARLFSRSVDLSGRQKMLDLGGGSGASSIVATKTFPGLKAIVLDLPPVTVVAQEYITANDAGDRPTTLPGEFTRTPLT